MQRTCSVPSDAINKDCLESVAFRHPKFHNSFISSRFALLNCSQAVDAIVCVLILGDAWKNVALVWAITTVVRPGIFHHSLLVVIPTAFLAYSFGQHKEAMALTTRGHPKFGFCEGEQRMYGHTLQATWRVVQLARTLVTISIEHRAWIEMCLYRVAAKTGIRVHDPHYSAAFQLNRLQMRYRTVKVPRRSQTIFKSQDNT